MNKIWILGNHHQYWSVSCDKCNKHTNVKCLPSVGHRGGFLLSLSFLCKYKSALKWSLFKNKCVSIWGSIPLRPPGGSSEQHPLTSPEGWEAGRVTSRLALAPGRWHLQAAHLFRSRAPGGHGGGWAQRTLTGKGPGLSEFPLLPCQVWGRPALSEISPRKNFLNITAFYIFSLSSISTEKR